MSQDAELSFDDAFDLYANGKEPEVNKATEDTSTEDNATNTTDTTTTTSEVADETNDTAATPPENGHESSDSPTTIEEAVAQAKLWEQRFKSYEGRVQAEMERRREEELMRQQQFISAMGTNKQQAQATPDENAVPSKFKQLSQEFPEIAEAVQELLDQRFNDASGMVKRAIDERISPIAADMSQQKVSSHLERILAKHPDAIQLRQGGRLDSWINTLPVYAQHGARYVVNSGTADEVVALLDQYKVTKNTNTNNQNTDKPTQEDTGANRGQVSQGMVEAVKAGLAVRPGRSSDPKTEATRSKKDDFDSGWEQALKDLGMN